jgi:hypothetical protein
MKKTFSLLCIIFIFIGCSTKPIVESSIKSQLELRNMQSKKILNTDIKFLSKAVLQVLQDDEFVILNSDSSLGYFSAKKKLDGGKESYKFAWYDIYYPIAIYKLSTLATLVKEINATISIRVYEDYSVLRASFNSDLLDEDGKLKSSRTIEEAKFYQDFFAKVDKALFLEKNNL